MVENLEDSRRMGRPEKKVTWSRNLLQVRSISPRQKSPRTPKMAESIARTSRMSEAVNTLRGGPLTQEGAGVKDCGHFLAWPKMTADASDLEFGVTITPDRKVVTKFGWEWAGVKKVYLDVVGNNPWIGDYKLSRKGEFEEISGSTYKMKWTGHGETTKGFL